jgi:hypothetical protein
MTQQLVEIIPRFAASILCFTEKTDQAASSCNRVAACTMAPGYLDAEIIRDVVERSSWKLRKKPSSKSHRAELVARNARA